MDVIYAALIVENERTFKSIPNVIKPRVRRVLEALGYPELAE